MSDSAPDLRWPEGLRRTPVREQILRVLTHAPRPLTVHEIQAAVAGITQAPVWLSTLYRTLERFTQLDLVSRIVPPGGSQAVYERKDRTHRHYAFCIGCAKMIAVAHCPIQSGNVLVADHNFRVTGHKLEVFGYCADCVRAGKADQTPPSTPR